MEPVFPSFTKTWHNTAYAAIDPTRPELSAKGKVVVVTGGGSGIGPVIVDDFAKAGATKIAIIGRTEKSLLATKSSIEEKYPESTVLAGVADVSDAVAVERVFSEIKTQFGAIDILVSNAGYLPNIISVKTTPVDEWFKGYEVNVKGALIVSQA